MEESFSALTRGARRGTGEGPRVEGGPDGRLGPAVEERLLEEAKARSCQ